MRTARAAPRQIIISNCLSQFLRFGSEPHIPNGMLRIGTQHMARIVTTCQAIAALIKINIRERRMTQHALVTTCSKAVVFFQTHHHFQRQIYTDSYAGSENDKLCSKNVAYEPLCRINQY